MTGNEEIYKSLIENSNEYIYRIVYNDKKIIDFYNNCRAADFFGVNSDELTSVKTWIDFVYTYDKKRVKEFLYELQNKYNLSQMDHRIVTATEEIKWVSNFCRSLFNESDGTWTLFGYMQDMTKKNKSIRQLRTLSRAVEQSPASVVITDIEGNIEYVNPKFTQLTGYTLPEVMGQNPRILKSGFMESSAYEKMWDTILVGNDWTGEFHNKKKNGDLYWEIASISPVRDENGNIGSFLAVKEDITEIKEIEKKLRESQAELKNKNDAYENELHYAQQVQRALLPLFPPSNRHIEIKYRFKPLEAIGGDYFSFFTKDDDISVFIGDVAGHGVSAALFLALLKYITETVSLMYFDKPQDYLTELNSILNLAMVNNFITAVYAYFKPSEDGIDLFYANGGHPAILVYRKSENIMQTVKVKGTILGMFPDMQYNEKHIHLNKGDRVFMYTDGIPETKNNINEIIGYEEIADVVFNSACDTLDATLDNIMSTLDIFRNGEPVEDDLFLIAFEIF